MANNLIQILIQAKDQASTTLSSVSGEIQNLGSRSVETEGKTGGLSDRLSSFKNTLVSVGTAFVAYQIVGSIEKMGTAAISAAGELEQTNMSFQNLIGNTQQANKLFGDLVQYANTTPFESKDVTAAAKQLLAFGETASDTAKVVKQLGDVTAAGGGDLQALSLVTGQVFAQGKMRAQDMYQVINDGGAGLIKIMAQQAGGMQKLTAEFDAGGIPAADYFKAIDTATGKQGFAFQGALKQAGTLNGQLSTLADSATQFGEALLGVHTDPQLGLQIEPGGLFDRMKTAIGTVSEKLSDWTPAVQRVVPIVIGRLGDMTKSVYDAIAGLANWHLWLGRVTDAASYLAQKLSAGLKLAVNDTKIAFDMLLPSLIALKNAIFDQLIPAVANLFRSLEPELTEALKDVAKILAGAVFAAIWISVKALTALVDVTAQVSNGLADVIDKFKGSTAATIFAQFIQQVFIPVMRQIAHAIRDELLPAEEQLMASWRRMWDALNPGLTDALKVVGGIIGGLFVAAVWIAIEAVKFFVVGLSIATTVISTLIDWMANLVGWAGNIEGAMINAYQAIFSLFSNLVPAVVDVVKTIGGIFAGLGGLIISSIGDAGSWLYNTGKQIVLGMIHGIEDSVSDVGSAIVGVGKDVGNSVTGALHKAHIPGFATGGFTGPGGQNEVAGIVHKGEYVVPKSQVDQSTGLPKTMGDNGPKVSVVNHIYNQIDLNRMYRDVAWKMAAK